MMTFLLLFVSLIIPPGLWDHSYLPFQFSGAWVIMPDEAAHLGSYRQASSGTLTFEFYGSGFALYGVADEGFGTAEICVNDECVTASWDAPVTLYSREIISIAELSHDELQVVTVTANGDGAITIDAVYIAPPPPQFTPESTPEPAPAWMQVSPDGSSVIVNTTTSGESAILVVLVMVFIMSAIGTLIRIMELTRSE